MFGYGQNTEYAFRIYLKNKTATQYALNQPEQYLSQRAIHRRQKYNIPIDSSDLPVCRSYIDSILSFTGGRLHCTSKWENTIVVLLQDTSTIPQLSSIAFFKKAVLVAIYPFGLNKPSPDSTAPYGQRPTGFDQAFYGAAWTQIHLCHGAYLHKQGFTGKHLLIALIDAGFEGLNNGFPFDSLMLRGQIKDRWNFVHDTIETNNEGGHGTEVLSCISGNAPNTFVGTAIDADVALYTSEDLQSEQPIEMDNWVAAAERADSLGVDIITTSLGYNTFDSPFSNETYPRLNGHQTFVAKGANGAARKGILVLCSAGNEGLSPWHYILTPGDADSALTVGAVDADNNNFQRSSYGPNFSGMIKPDVVALGVNNVLVNSNGSIQSGSGTSFATPIIAGLSACLMQADVNAPPRQIKQIIRASSDNYANPTGQRGYGLPDFSKAYADLTKIEYLKKDNKPNVIIYPNPSRQNAIHITFPFRSYYHGIITVRNIRGQTILRQPFSSRRNGNYLLSIPFHLSDGMYFVMIKTTAYCFRQKWVKL